MFVDKHKLTRYGGGRVCNNRVSIVTNNVSIRGHIAPNNMAQLRSSHKYTIT